MDAGTFNSAIVLADFVPFMNQHFVAKLTPLSSGMNSDS